MFKVNDKKYYLETKWFNFYFFCLFFFLGHKSWHQHPPLRPASHPCSCSSPTSWQKSAERSVMGFEKAELLKEDVEQLKLRQGTREI